MIINKAYKVELSPNNRQRTLLAQSAGCARFAYNWGLAQRIELYKNEKKSTTAINQHKELCSLKKLNACTCLGVHLCLAHLVELRPLKPMVAGSNPAASTKHRIGDLGIQFL